MTSPLKALDRLVFRLRELAFDLRYGVNTRGHVQLAGLRVTGPHREQGTVYAGSDAKLLTRALSRLTIDHSQYTFIDFGAGKGKVLIVAAQYPFRAVIGIEFSIALADAAKKNLERRRGGERAGRVEVLLMDATEYELPLEPLVVFMYNPFHREIVQRVVDRILESLARHPRPLLLVYLNPLHREVMDSTGAFTILHDVFYCLIYEWSGPTR